jgi:hypothetical protein
MRDGRMKERRKEGQEDRKADGQEDRRNDKGREEWMNKGRWEVKKTEAVNEGNTEGWLAVQHREAGKL